MTYKTKAAVRYFYDDPIAAAYMAREFGVRFKYWRWNDLAFQFQPVNKQSQDAATDKLYILPNSLSIFEPQLGDFLHWGLYPVGSLEEHSCVSAGQDFIGALRGGYVEDWVKIVQRNGKPFFWPKEEV